MEETTQITPPVEQAEVETVEETVGEPVEETQTVEETPKTDRSEYNCVDCKGEGLTEDQKARCATCGGTVKV